MRPQIRSVPLSKAECPQFTWAVRNNSENVSEALQPDLQRTRHKYEIECKKMSPRIKHCKCVGQILKPTLFPHPATCVCSNLPSPPTNEKYRFCRVNIDEPIGEVMKDVILNNIPTPCTNPFCTNDRIMKKIIRSACLPEEVVSTNEKACLECLAEDANLLREFKDRMEYTKAVDKDINQGKRCTKPCEEKTDGCKYMDDTYRRMEADNRCVWKPDAICNCKPVKREICDDNICNCRRNLLQCCCEPPMSPRQFVPQNSMEETKQEEEEESTKSPGTKITKPKEIKKKPTKSPKEASKWKRPNNIICERLEVVQTKPEELQTHQNQEPKLVPIYEHYPGLRPQKSDVSRTPSETPEKHPQPDSSKNKPNQRKGGKPKQRIPAKLPWNWHNQPKPEDPMKKWKGTKYSWSKKSNFAKLNRSLDDSQKIPRSRGGEDARDTNEENKNLRPRGDDQDEELIRRVEERKYKRGYGRIRVKNWHEKNEEENELSEEDALDDEYPTGGTRQRSMSPQDSPCANTMDVSEDHAWSDEESSANRVRLAHRLSTIMKEKSRNRIDISRTHRLEKQGETIPRLRPKTADELEEKPFFNVIKQRIHSRHKTLENLDKFRNDIFPKPDHTCVHRFTIDDRLFPKPLHSNDSGISCCIHCDKPMANEKTVFVDQRESREKLSKDGSVKKEASTFSLVPKPVHMGAKNTVMEVRLEPEQEDLLEKGVGSKGVFYPDSLALRHQRWW